MHDGISLRARLPGLGPLALAIWLVACTASGAATPPGSGAGCASVDGSNTVSLHAKDIKFSAPCIDAMAGKPIVIKFFNDEPVSHDVVVYKDSTKATELGRSEIITGPDKQTTVTVPPQQPGQLYFECSIHNAMNGALVVEPEGAPS